METRIALIGIIVDNMEVVEELNKILHEYGKYIVGRMGIPSKLMEGTKFFTRSLSLL